MLTKRGTEAPWHPRQQQQQQQQQQQTIQNNCRGYQSTYLPTDLQEQLSKKDPTHYQLGKTPVNFHFIVTNFKEIKVTLYVFCVAEIIADEMMVLL